jgi:hypothetical protein
MEGAVVDCDEDLVSLCNRMQASDSKHCAILYCEPSAYGGESAPTSSRVSSVPPPTPPRAYH